MDADTHPPSTLTPAEISFVRGGPFYRAQPLAGLIRPNQWNLGRRITVLVGIGWLRFHAGILELGERPPGLHCLRRVGALSWRLRHCERVRKIAGEHAAGFS